MTDYTEELNSVAESFRQCPSSFLWGVLDIVEAELVLRGFPEDNVAPPETVKMNNTSKVIVNKPQFRVIKGDKE